jgi:hypothetical protein
MTMLDVCERPVNHSADAGKMVDFERVAELDGVEAFVSGGCEGENPFTPGHALHEIWLQGFREAQARTAPRWQYTKDARARHGC